MTGLVFSGAAAQAAVPGPGWAISSLAEPTNFAFADDGLCPGDIEGHEEFICAAYAVTVLNTGSTPSTGTIKIEDELPAGVEVDAPGGTPFVVARTLEESAEEGFSSRNVSCASLGTSGREIECTYAKPVPAGSGLNVEIHVLVRGPKPETATNSVRVEGGGAAPAATEASNALNGEASPFGVQDFGIDVYEADGAIDTRAGDHPSSLTATLDLTSALDPHGSFLAPDLAVEEPKTVTLELPLGLVANLQAAAQCPEADLTQGGEPACPLESRVGEVAIDKRGELISSLEGHAAKLSYIYNMVPEPGFPAEFAFKVASTGIFMYASIVPGPSGYRLHVTVPDIPRAIVAADGISITFFGDPGERNGDPGASPAFLTNPTACSNEPLSARVEADSWVKPQRWVSTPAEPVVYPKIEGCDTLQFNPTIAVAPEETTQADTPSGYEIDVKVPQAQDLPGVPATPELKDTTVTLPAGVSISPPAAQGLAGCAATGPEGINIEGAEATELGEGSRDGSFYEDGVEHARAGRCPPVSIVGEVEIETPLLPQALKGRVFLAQPQCGDEGRSPCSEADAEAGRMLGLYLEAASSGVNIKLAGTVEVGGYGAQNGLLPGQLRAKFRDAPQLPFSSLKLRLERGSRMLLASPQTCGSFTGTSELVPWSTPETPSAMPSSSFAVTGCASPQPFAPSFSAGTATASAGAPSAFTLTFARRDGEQNLSSVSVTTPPGLLAMLSTVTPCGEPQAAMGTCAQASEIGTATVGAGSGEDPLSLMGHIYLTTGYRGAPFGLEIAVPAAVGPFRLAGTTGSGSVLVRASIAVDPHSASLTISSDSLPQIVDGVPLRLRTVSLDIDRSGFVLNPTSCNPQQIAGTIAGALPNGAQGASAPVSSPFALTGCKGLPFKPKLTALTHAQTSKAYGAYVHVKIVSEPGQANIAKVKVDLPKRLPSRMSTLQQACPAAVFEANPAGCPPASVAGVATVVTPILKNPLKGSAYLVSHGGVAFPALEIVLKGEEGVVIDLDGQTAIRKGVVSATFRSLPDAPIGTFDLVLPAGPRSLLGANGNLCKKTLAMPTALTGQNGAVIHTSTKIAVIGCPPTRVRHGKVRVRKK